MRFKALYLLVFINFYYITGNAQIPGIIIRPAGTGGPAILDLNGNGYTSILTSGFGNNDITNSEIPFNVIAPVIAEPTGDLLRGPSGYFSDIVKTVDGSGFYLFNDGVNLLCRLRIGGIVSGSKGYSVLLDTDQRIGASGSNADPNFQPATNGNNGNPGFELEVVLETNFRIAIYNVDGTSIPVLLTSYPINSNSQVSMASSTDGGNPDYFYDFYVPIAAMGITSSTPIRATATTVMSPGPAMGGPKSDIYGLGVNNYMSDWTNIILLQPAFTFNAISITGTGINATCTQPPTMNEPIAPTTTTVTGVWIKSPFSSQLSATITLYKGASIIGTTTVSSGGSWSIAVSGLANNDILTAKAQATGESSCVTSNEVTVSNCSGTSHTATPIITCSSLRGFEGTMVAGASVKLYKLTSTGYSLYADDATTTYLISYPTTTTWRYDNVNTQSSSACTGGPTDIAAGSYMAVAELAPICASIPAYVCIGGTAAPSVPVVTSFLVDGAATISGTATAGSGVMLWIDGYLIQSVTATAGGVFTFNLPKKLSLNQAVEIKASTTGSCTSTSFTATVSCYIASPVITADASGRVTSGSQLAGTSAAAEGTTITVYNASTLAVIGTTSVQANGMWLLSSPVIALATTYKARVTGTSSGSSAESNTATGFTGTSIARCGTITGPVSESAATISGTISTAVANTTVTLYADEISIGSVIIAGTAWSIPVNRTIYNRIYPGAIITIDISETSKTAINCTASLTVDCNPPVAPVISLASTVIVTGQTVTYTVSSSQAGILYSVRNSDDTGNMGESVFGNGYSITINTDPFNVQGTYSLKLKATSFSGNNCIALSEATVTVTGTLPLSLTNFYGKYEYGISVLNWETDFEQDIHSYEVERSYTPDNFNKIGMVYATGNSQVKQFYSFNDADAKSGLIYYRLKIIDNSTGGNKYSKVLLLRSDNGIVFNPVAPNPFENSINLNFNSPIDFPLVIFFSDITGRHLKKIAYTAKKGSNDVSINNLQHLSPGTYILELISDGKKVHRQLLLKK